MENLIAAAVAIREKAFAPYSNYRVGAALLGDDGSIYSGCNVENASYSLCVCAERNAIAAMVAAGCKTWTRCAVVTENGGTPCGACLQVLSEFASDQAACSFLICAEGQGNVEVLLSDLFPSPFRLPAKRDPM